MTMSNTSIISLFNTPIDSRNSCQNKSRVPRDHALLWRRLHCFNMAATICQNWSTKQNVFWKPL